MKNKFLILVVVAIAFVQDSIGQVNFLGKPGVMTTPSASWEEERQLTLSFSYIPREYSEYIMAESLSLNNNILNFYNARVALTSYFEVGFTVIHRPLIKNKIGIGDRQLDFRFRLLKEKKYSPAIVFGWTPPGSSSPVMSHDYLVATKNFDTGIGDLSLTAGYGSPYVFPKNRDNEGIRDFIRIEDKTYFNKADYLTGFFGSLTYSPVASGGLMIEYNTKTLNAGAYIKLWDLLQLQGYTFEGKEWAFQVAGHFSLDRAPFALRRHEKRLD